mgnify:CR=1 FL=1
MSPPRPVKAERRGGARAGAGRKPDSLPEDSLERIGAPPVDSPLLMARWWSSMLGELGWLRARGLVKPEVAGDLRSLAATAGKLVPEDLRGEVDRLIKEKDRSLKPEAQGPKLEVQRGEQPSLRGVPR